MGIVIDTDVLILADRGRVALDLGRFRDEEMAYISAITASELLVGVLRAQDSAVSARRTAFVENLLAALPTLPVGLETARVHAQLLAHLPSHETIGAHDALIGATALRHGYAVLTRNVRDFRKLAGVRVLEYTAAS